MTYLVSLSAVFSYGVEGAAFGLGEGKSVGDSREVFKRISDWLGVQLHVGNMGTLGEDLDLVLQLRHCLVHSLGVLSAHDSIKLKARDKVNHRVVIDADVLAETVGTIDRAVRAINQTVFETIEKRWWFDGHLDGNEATDLPLFQQLIIIFWSNKDKGEPDFPALYHTSKDHWENTALRAQAKRVTTST